MIRSATFPGHGLSGSGSTSSDGSTHRTSDHADGAATGAGTGVFLGGALGRAMGGGPGFCATKSNRHTSQKRAPASARGSPHDGHALALAALPAPALTRGSGALAAGMAAPHTEQ